MVKLYYNPLMKKLTIEDKIFNLNEIKQLYPAVLVKTGYKNETTEMSLEWIDHEARGRVEIAGYGLFVCIGEEKYSFIYKQREALEEIISEIAKQMKYYC